ncbi:uncharacterized protein LOC120079239 [Benincasa hispida]|uniref:uncharacterized protein LOC120079239 n=1 Tax=Benincasa hispida TaxID=102211 RepID=UPI001901DDD7|nr:uncharacterized protein LOC120079239 [Benincasa hispida]
MRIDNQEVKFNVLNALKFLDNEECQPNKIELPEEEATQVCEVLTLEESMKELEPPSLSERQTKPTRPSLEEPLELELKSLPNHLKYAFLGLNNTLPIIILANLSEPNEYSLLQILQKHMRAIGWTLADIRGISPSYCMYKIRLEEGKTGSIKPQRRLNPIIKEVVKKEILKWLDARVIYPISDSSWVSPVKCVLKKGGTIVIVNSNNELNPSRIITGWRFCMDYRKLNVTTKKDHFPLPFIDQMLDRLAGKEFYFFLDGYSGYNQILIDPEDQEKTKFTCPFGTFTLEACPLDYATHLEHSKGIVLGHKVSKVELEFDEAKVDVIAKLSPPSNVKALRSFLGHVGFY